jgi:Fe-Mn family superoxide dismutase
VNTLPDSVRTAVRNNGGGHANHSLFWETLAPASASGKPSGKLATAIDKTFGSQAQLEDRLKAAATAVFGSGWGWVSVAPSGALAVEAMPNQDSLITAGRKPLFGIDVWEHAYYLKYQNRRADYLAAITHVLNWDFISHRYEELAR